MKKHIIIAPHADDEIIGCHSVLIAGAVEIVAFPYGTGAAEEAVISSKRFGFEIQEFKTPKDINELVQRASVNGGLVFMPDPIHDYHPLHKQIGHFGETHAKMTTNIAFYSTKMNAPYIDEYDHPGIKKKDLDDCYPDKQSLWEYDHRYFLFEGFMIWGIPKALL